MSEEMASPWYLLAGEILGQDANDYIADLRSQGKSWDRIAKELWLATDRRIDVNGVTVKSWTENGNAA